MINVGDVVTLHLRGDQDDRASGRVVEIRWDSGWAIADLDMGGGRRRSHYVKDLVRFGLDRDDTMPWAEGQAVILLDSYPNGVNAGQIGRVVAVSQRIAASGSPSVMLLVRARGPIRHHQGWVDADRVYRIPS